MYISMIIIVLGPNNAKPGCGGNTYNNPEAKHWDSYPIHELLLAEHCHTRYHIECANVVNLLLLEECQMQH